MHSTHAVVVNVEDDHCWSVGGVEALEECFRTLGSQAEKVFTWETEKTRELYIDHSAVKFLNDGDIESSLNLPLAGYHNRINATLALAVAADLGVSRDQGLEALRSFPGVSRRLTCHFR